MILGESGRAHQAPSNDANGPTFEKNGTILDLTRVRRGGAGFPAVGGAPPAPRAGGARA